MRLFCCVTLILVLTWGAPGCRAAVQIDGADAAFKTSGERIPKDWGKAEDGWVLYENGEVGDYVSVTAPGDYTVVLRAAGQGLQGKASPWMKWPMLSITVDGRPIGEATIDHEAFRDRKFPVKLGIGVHCIAVWFWSSGPQPDNFATAGWRDARDVFISRLEVRGGAAPDALQRSTRDAWRESNRRQLQAEEAFLAAADQRIEQQRKAAAAVRVVDAAGQPIPGARVEVELDRHDFLFGCNILSFDRQKTEAEKALYKQRFAELCNYATVGFYWSGYEPERGKPHYDQTDRVVAWCQAHGIALKGHPLLWEQPSGIPKWSQGQPSPELQERRVRDIIGRYKGQITSWEVVNEPGHSLGGPGAIAVDEPYRWAREADPQAYLNMNDFAVFSDGCPKYFEVLQKALAAKVPFDGIGIQGHDPETIRFPLSVLQQELDHYATLGKELSITELTPPSAGPMTGLALQDTWDEAAQADYAVKLYRTFFAHPAVVAITWWDLADGGWRANTGLLRKDLSRKPAYTALQKLIHEEWHTKAAGATGAEGRFEFRGYYGTYRVKVTAGWQTVETRFHLDRKNSSDRTWTVAVDAGK